jgi:predicted nucleic acid-binding protein
MRIVLDTNVVITGIRRRQGASRFWLRAALTGSYTLLATPPIFLEYEAALRRLEQLAATGATVAQVNAILDALAAVLEQPVEVTSLWRPQLRDSADEMVLEAAVNGRTNCLVIFNLRHLSTAAARFGSRPDALLTFSSTARRLHRYTICKSNFALRLQASLMEELRKAAEADGTTINQYINVAVVEKLAAATPPPSSSLNGLLGRIFRRP